MPAFKLAAAPASLELCTMLCRSGTLHHSHLEGQRIQKEAASLLSMRLNCSLGTPCAALSAQRRKDHCSCWLRAATACQSPASLVAESVLGKVVQDGYAVHSPAVGGHEALKAPALPQDLQ